MDECNRRFGRGAVVRARAGLEEKRTWSTKFEMRSARYTGIGTANGACGRRGDNTFDARAFCPMPFRRQSVKRVTRAEAVEMAKVTVRALTAEFGERGPH